MGLKVRGAVLRPGAPGRVAVVGAGVGRTGTKSLKEALEVLLGGTCHHMLEVFPRPEQIEGFTAAINGETIDWSAFLSEFTAMVDFPGSLFWREIAAANPDAPILLSSRPAQDWYKSAKNTIFLHITSEDPWMLTMRKGFQARFCDDVDNPEAMMAAYERHNAQVRAEVPAERLIDWKPGDGYAPICERLGLPIPDVAFPHTNTTAEFRAMIGADPL